jgi:hypothetical protein
MEWLGSRGALVLTPHGHSPDYDLVADLGNRLVRIQVKTCICWINNRWSVTLCTRGGNRSWSGLVKKLDASRCDYVFVLAGDGRRWCIPAARVDGATGLLLGGPKYARYEIEPGHPLPPRTDEEPSSTIVSLDPRGDVRVAKGGGL